MKIYFLALTAVLLSFIIFNPVSQSSYTYQGPPGVIFQTSAPNCPPHSIVAEGSSQLRAGTYANLFQATGTVNGAADGTHFNVIDLRGKFPRGYDHGASNDPDHSSRTACVTGGATGNAIGSCEAHAFQDHVHNLTIYGNYLANGNIIAGTTVTGGGATSNSSNGAVTGNVSTESRPINVYVLYCVWY